MKKMLCACLAILLFTSSCHKKDKRKIFKEKLESFKSYYEKKLTLIKDTLLKEQIMETGMAYAVAGMGGLFNFEDEEKFDGISNYEDNPFGQVSLYPDLDDFENNYKKSLLLNLNGSIYIKKTMKNPFYTKINWQQINLNNGEILKVSKDVDSSFSKRQAYIEERFGELKINDPATPIFDPKENIKSALITLNSILPKQIIKIKFSKNEEGKTKEVNGVKVKLIAVNDNNVELQIMNNNLQSPDLPSGTEEVTILAMDKTNKNLSFKSSSSHAAAGEDFYKKRLDMLLEEKDFSAPVKLKYQKMDSLFQEENPGYTYKKVFNGFVEDIEVVVMDYSSVTSRTDLFEVYNTNIFTPQQNLAYFKKQTAKVYSTEQEFMHNNLDLETNNVAKEVTVSIDTLTKDDYPFIQFSYPEKYLSNQFISSSSRFVMDRKENRYGTEATKEEEINKITPFVKFYDYGTFGFFRKEIPLIEDEAYNFSGSQLKFDYEKLKHRIPRLVKGMVYVLRNKIYKTSFSTLDIPKGFTIEGNLFGDTGENNSYGDDYIIQAKDKTGKLIAQSYKGRESYKDSINGETINKKITSFYGEINQVIIYSKGKEEKVPYYFSIELPIPNYEKMLNISSQFK